MHGSVIHKVYEFYAAFYRISFLLPKKDRFSIGLKIEAMAFELLEFLLLAEVESRQVKITALKKADLKLKGIKLMVRLTFEVKAINQSKYIALEERLLEIGRMLGGWIKQVNMQANTKGA